MLETACPEAVQITGLLGFRQPRFLDITYTHGYISLFLPGTSVAYKRMSANLAGDPGGVAQLGERLNGIQEVRGSIPLTSTWAADVSRCLRE